MVDEVGLPDPAATIYGDELGPVRADVALQQSKFFVATNQFFHVVSVFLGDKNTKNPKNLDQNSDFFRVLVKVLAFLDFPAGWEAAKAIQHRHPSVAGGSLSPPLFTASSRSVFPQGEPLEPFYPFFYPCNPNLVAESATEAKKNFCFNRHFVWIKCVILPR